MVRFVIANGYLTGLANARNVLKGFFKFFHSWKKRGRLLQGGNKVATARRREL